MTRTSWAPDVRSGALAIVLVVLVAGTAVAVWLASGSGSGTASAGTVAAVTLTPGTPSAQLYPGGSADVRVTITNTNTSPVTVPTLRLDTVQGAGGFAASGGCPVAALSFVTQTNGGAGWSVPAQVGSTPGTLAATLPAALSMGTGASNACQGATFTVYLAVDS